MVHFSFNLGFNLLLTHTGICIDTALEYTYKEEISFFPIFYLLSTSLMTWNTIHIIHADLLHPQPQDLYQSTANAVGCTFKLYVV